MKSFTAILSDLNVIDVSGEDAGSFLQAQFTSDISSLDDPGSQTAAWCNPQGRVIANFLIAHQKDRYLLVLPADMTAKICQRLSMYVLRSRVLISDKSDEYQCLGVSGSEAREWFHGKSDDDTSRWQSAMIGPPAYVDNREIIIDMQAGKPPLQEKINTAIPTGDDQLWQKLDILAGWPWITTNTSEKILPQELGLDRLGGLSYDKGCYPGQEVISRLRFRGKIINQLYCGISSMASPSMLPGVRLYAGRDSNLAGTVINAVRHGDNRQLLLAVVNNERTELGSYFLEDGNDIHIKFYTPGVLTGSEADVNQ